MAEALAYFRGGYVPLADANVNITTHALHYGTAVFEGIRGNWNEAKGEMHIFRAREHYERLLQGCKIMLMDIPYSADELMDITVELLKRTGYREDVYIRPIAYKSEELVANLIHQGRRGDPLLHLFMEAHRRHRNPISSEDRRALRQQHPG